MCEMKLYYGSACPHKASDVVLDKKSENDRPKPHKRRKTVLEHYVELTKIKQRSTNE